MWSVVSLGEKQNGFYPLIDSGIRCQSALTMSEQSTYRATCKFDTKIERHTACILQCDESAIFYVLIIAILQFESIFQRSSIVARDKTGPIRKKT